MSEKNCEEQFLRFLRIYRIGIIRTFEDLGFLNFFGNRTKILRKFWNILNVDEILEEFL
jgi:hypothetical protein